MKTIYNTLLEKELKDLIDTETGLLSSLNSSTIKCPLCNTEEAQQKELFIKRGYRFVLCPECGLVFANPLVNADRNSRNYEHAKSFEEWAVILQTDSQETFDLGLYSCIGEAVKSFILSSSPNCLDISMRGGLASKCPAFSGWNFDFLDFSKETRKLGKSRYPSRNFYGSFADVIDSSKRYEVIISMEAIEHFRDPVYFIKNVSELLTDNGVFCGVLSNVESLLVRILGSEAPMFDGLYQKYFFHTESLKKLFSLVGINEVSFMTAISCKDKIINYLNRMIPEGLCVDSVQIINQLAEYAGYYPLGYKLVFSTRKSTS